MYFFLKITIIIPPIIIPPRRNLRPCRGVRREVRLPRGRKRHDRVWSRAVRCGPQGAQRPAAHWPRHCHRQVWLQWGVYQGDSGWLGFWNRVLLSLLYLYVSVYFVFLFCYFFASVSFCIFSKPPPQKAKDSGCTLHIMGILSDGKVHSSLQHMEALLALCGKAGLKKEQVRYRE